MVALLKLSSPAEPSAPICIFIPSPTNVKPVGNGADTYLVVDLTLENPTPGAKLYTAVSLTVDCTYPDDNCIKALAPALS